MQILVGMVRSVEKKKKERATKAFMVKAAAVQMYI